MTKLPTRMKIQAHPGFPPFPFMFMIAAASKPEKAPDSEADAKNVATLQVMIIKSNSLDT